MVRIITLLAPFYPNEAEKQGVNATVTGLIFSTYTIVLFIGTLLSTPMIKFLGLPFMMGSGMFLGGGSVILFGLLELCPAGDSYITLSFLLRITQGTGAVL